MALVWLTISVFPSLPECPMRATLWCRVSGIDTHEAERIPLILINNGLASYHFHEATLSGICLMASALVVLMEHFH